VTGGLFDITVEPVITFVRRHFETHGTPPPDEALQERVFRIGIEGIRLDRESIAFSQRGMGITLDGIAKGYIVDRAIDVLLRAEIRQALVDAGGDMRAVGGKEAGKPWVIAVQDPWRDGKSIDTLLLREGAVATSGNYRIYFDDEKVFHHIVDPSSGRSPLANASTTIRCRTAIEADALSTALFLMDPESGLTFVERRPSVEALIVTRSGRRITTKDWKASG
jgi:thiamine biosynthesis lipoprotein